MKQTLGHGGAAARSLLDTYSTVLFSDRWTVGLLVLAATMIDPWVGVSGLLGATWAVLLSRVLGFDTWDGRTGVFAFNSMLTCLGAGYFFPAPQADVAMWLGLVVFASTLAMLAFVAFNALSLLHLRLPSMSLAFSTVAILLSFFALVFEGFELFGGHHELLVVWEPNMPHFWLWYFKSLGSIFFQTGFAAGLLVALALAVATRFGLLLSLVGYAVSYLFIDQMGMLGLYDISYIGLNGILVALAIGGTFLVPSRTALLLAAVGALTSVFMTLALQSIFYRYTIPPYAFPFNLTVLLLVFALGQRLRNRRPYVVDYGVRSPEESLRYFLSRILRFYQTGAPQFYLPFKGRWRVTQGNNGDITHKLQWAYAWDFEVFDDDGANYRGKVDKLDDYYAYRKPVLASADGWVARVVDGIDDNPVGQINTRENWGNLVVLHHGGGVYSMYCHLRPGSVRPREGDWVRRGERLGAVGNSGRSAVPHLHFNVQLGPEPGSPTLESYLVNYRSEGEHETFTGFGIPGENEEVAPLARVRNLQDRLHLKVEDTSRFRVNSGGHAHTERWDTRVDLLGNLQVVSNRHSRLSFSVFDGIYNTLGFSGNRRSALWALGALLTRQPFEEDRGLAWSDEPPFRIFLPRWQEELLMLLHPLLKPLRLKAVSHSQREKNRWRVCTTVELRLFGRLVRTWEGFVVIEQFVGVRSLELRRGDQVIVQATRIEEEETT
ncbi:MAG: urea transporter [Candidatus Cloacimonetes bacterium]|nr:urea transporter [Candidatus Cloacimonadota bacterium]